MAKTRPYIVTTLVMAESKAQATEHAFELLRDGGEPESVEVAEVANAGKALYEVYAVYDPDNAPTENRRERFYTAHLTDAEVNKLRLDMAALGLTHPMVRPVEGLAYDDVRTQIESDFDGLDDEDEDDHECIRCGCSGNVECANCGSYSCKEHSEYCRACDETLCHECFARRHDNCDEAAKG